MLHSCHPVIPSPHSSYRLQRTQHPITCVHSTEPLTAPHWAEMKHPSPVLTGPAPWGLGLLVQLGLLPLSPLHSNHIIVSMASLLLQGLGLCSVLPLVICLMHTHPSGLNANVSPQGNGFHSPFPDLNLVPSFLSLIEFGTFFIRFSTFWFNKMLACHWAQASALFSLCFYKY